MIISRFFTSLREIYRAVFQANESGIIVIRGRTSNGVMRPEVLPEGGRGLIHY